MARLTKAGTLSLHTRHEITDEIVRRADAMGIKKGTFAALILERWYSQGCPPVSMPDELLQQAAGKMILIAADRQAPYGKK